MVTQIEKIEFLKFNGYVVESGKVTKRGTQLCSSINYAYELAKKQSL